MFGFYDSFKNEITLSQLLTSYPGERGIDKKIKAFLPEACSEALYGDYGAGTISNVRNGKAYARFKNCADILDKSAVKKIFDNWKSIWKNVTAFDGDDRKKILPRDCAIRITNGERETLRQSCPKLLSWLDNALNLCNESYLPKIFAVLTILAITRDKPENERKNWQNWRKMSELLTTGDFLPSLSTLPDNPSLEIQRAFQSCQDLYQQGEFEQAKIFLNDAIDKDKPLWNSEVYRQLARLRLDSPTDALELFRTARKYIEDALKEPSINEYKIQLVKQWQEISSEYLAETIRLFDCGGENFVQDFKEAFSRENFCRQWQGETYFRLAQFYRSRDNTKFLMWLERGVESDNHQAMNSMMEILWPLDAQEIPDPSSKAYILANRLQTSNLPQIRGSAHYRLYLAAQDTKKANRHLREAYNCDFAPAVSKYNDGIVSYCEKISRSTCEWNGQCLLNVTAENPLARIFLKTVPENWSVTCAAEKKIFYDSLKNMGNEQMICLLISDEQTNLADFLLVMEMLENPPSDSIIFIRGSQERLTPIVDTGLKQYFHGGHRPFLRVEILDDELSAARELFSKCPLFIPLLKVKEAATLHFVAVGSACRYLTKEAKWFMTFPDELKIKTKVSTFIEEEISDNLVTLIKQAIETGELLYFAVDEGDDLLTLSLAIKIREILTRVWLRYSVAPTPPAVPIAVRIKNPDFAFMSRRLIILGEEASGGSFNSYLLTNFGSYLHYTWKNLVQNNIYSRLALAVHMVYFGVHAGENFSDADCRAAFADFSSRTYNQRSSLAVAQSLPYRLFAMSRLLDVKIFDDDLADVENIFSATALKNFLTNEMITKLEKFYNLLEEIQVALSTLWNKLNESNCLKFGQEFSELLADFIARKKLSSCEQAEELLISLKQRDFSSDYELPENVVFSLLDKLTQLNGIVQFQLGQIKKCFIWENLRWSAYVVSEGWQSATTEESIRYIHAGNNGHHQNFLAKLHPCIELAWCHLKTLAQELEPVLGKLKDFRKLNKQLIFATGEILSESVLHEDDETPAHLRRLFCISRDELF